MAKMQFYWLVRVSRHRTHPKLKIFPCKKSTNISRWKKGRRRLGLVFVKYSSVHFLATAHSSSFFRFAQPTPSTTARCTFLSTKIFFFVYYLLRVCWFELGGLKNSIIEGYNNIFRLWHIHARHTAMYTNCTLKEALPFIYFLLFGHKYVKKNASIEND